MRMALYKMACTRLRPSDTRPDLIEAERSRTLANPAPHDRLRTKPADDQPARVSRLGVWLMSLDINSANSLR
jgi:hypothetical protein